MKIINEKGKLFGLVNLVDFLIVLAVVLVIGGVSYKVLSSKITEAVSVTQEMTFVVRVRGLYPRMESEIEAEVGAQLIAGNDYVKDAYVKAVAFEPYVQQVPTAEGIIVDAADPVRIDAVITVTARVPKNSAVIKVGTQEVRSGSGHFLKTKRLELATTVESIVLAD